MTLVGAIGVLLALTTDPFAWVRARNEKRVVEIGKKLIAAHEQGGSEALAVEAEQLDLKHGIRTFLYKGGMGPLSGRHAPMRWRRFAAMTAISGQPQHHRGRMGFRVAYPVEDDYVIIALLPPRSPLARLLNPHNLGLRLIATFIVGGFVCYFLARSLSSPILRLRKVTQNFAGGDLSARAGSDISGRGDEIGDLGRDFDLMAERIETMVHAQQRLLRDISHELRSPLARLNVALGLARQRSGPGSDAEHDRIEKEAERLNEMVSQLLTLTSLEGGVERMEKAWVPISPLLREVVDDADFEARNRHCSVNLDMAAEMMLYGSQEMIRRAIENVVRNAVRYTREETEVSVTVRKEVVDGENYAKIMVRDHGPGVPEGELEHIFRPFYRVEYARDRQTGGTGVGLAIAERAVRILGGRISASNASDGGLVIIIFLPVRRN